MSCLKNVLLKNVMLKNVLLKKVLSIKCPVYEISCNVPSIKPKNTWIRIFFWIRNLDPNDLRNVLQCPMSRFEPWSGVVMIVGWLPVTTVGISNTGSPIWTMSRCFKHTKSPSDRLHSGKYTFFSLINRLTNL